MKLYKAITTQLDRWNNIRHMVWGENTVGYLPYGQEFELARK